jgi:two-component system, NarL family, response regulator LiaR
MLTISLVEDDDVYRELLSQYITSTEELRLAGAYATAEEALKSLPGEKPDVALVDVKLCGMDGIECIRRLRQIVPSLATHFIILTGNEDDNLIFDALRSGAHGFLLKDKVSSENLLAAIKEVAAGGAPMTPVVARKVIGHFTTPRSPTVPLTDKEHNVLCGLSEGLMYKEIADKLSIPLNTLRKRVGSIYVKLHVKCRMNAVRHVQERSSQSRR